jgi:hypothetical protein
LLMRSSDLPSGRWRATTYSPSLVLLQVGFTRLTCLHATGELLPHHFNLTTALPVSAECFCCTFPIVTYAGRYPAPSPYGARTFLVLAHATVWLTQNIVNITSYDRLIKPFPTYAFLSFSKSDIPCYKSVQRIHHILWPPVLRKKPPHTKMPGR